MGFRIGAIESIGDPSSYKEKPDDRVVQTPCINGTFTEDLGLNESGLIVTCTITITEKDYESLLECRRSKSKVTIVTHRGMLLSNRIFKITEVAFIDGAPFRDVSLEIYSQEI